MASEQRFYLAYLCTEEGVARWFIGIFSNQNNLLKALREESCIDLSGVYIQGTRKRQEVTNSSLSGALRDVPGCNLFKDEIPYIKIIIMKMNELRDQFKKKEKEEEQ